MIVAVSLCAVLLAADAPASAPADDLASRMKKLESRVDDLEQENERLRALPRLGPASLTVMDGVKLRFTGYADVGFFKAAGDGVAYVRDPGKALNPGLAGNPWVFYGDPWSNPVNSQGDSADLGLDRSNIARFDPIQSHGKPSFIVNTVLLGISATAGEHLFFETTLAFEPRQGKLGSPGDLLDVPLAYIEYKPWRDIDLRLQAGKFESVFGREYRQRQAPDRFGVTPSIISRYTIGTPIGLKARGTFFDGLFTFAVAVTNGGTSTEKFGEFYNEIDQNWFKTVSGRLSLQKKFHTATPVSLELGGSGLFGAQDNQPSDKIHQWQVGGDLKFTLEGYTLEAEYLHSIADGGGLTQAPSLRADGFYVTNTYQILPWLGVLARVDLRKALLQSAPNLYVSNTLRATAGLRFDITFNVIAKLEYVRIQELSGPEIDDDVFTSSLLFRF